VALSVSMAGWYFLVDFRDLLGKVYSRGI
jgi:hypothetical protein